MEMGIRVHPNTWQDKIVKDNPDFDTLELQNYIYTVVEPDSGHLTPTQPWAGVELVERLYGQGEANPGMAWRERIDLWAQFIQKEDGKFSYTYDERLHFQYDMVVRELKKNPDSRQLFLAVWDPDIDIFRIGGAKRVPCSLGYLVQAREGMLHMTYLMRSSDFITHFQNDVWLAVCTQRWMANQVQLRMGRFTHYIGSLHIFKKDGEGVF